MPKTNKKDKPEEQWIEMQTMQSIAETDEEDENDEVEAEEEKKTEEKEIEVNTQTPEEFFADDKEGLDEFNDPEIDEKIIKASGNDLNKSFSMDDFDDDDDDVTVDEEEKKKEDKTVDEKQEEANELDKFVDDLKKDEVKVDADKLEEDAKKAVEEEEGPKKEVKTANGNTVKVSTLKKPAPNPLGMSFKFKKDEAKLNAAVFITKPDDQIKAEKEVRKSQIAEKYAEKEENVIKEVDAVLEDDHPETADEKEEREKAEREAEKEKLKAERDKEVQQAQYDIDDPGRNVLYVDAPPLWKRIIHAFIPSAYPEVEKFYEAVQQRNDKIAEVKANAQKRIQAANEKFDKETKAIDDKAAQQERDKVQKEIAEALKKKEQPEVKTEQPKKDMVNTTAQNTVEANQIKEEEVIKEQNELGNKDPKTVQEEVQEANIAEKDKPEDLKKKATLTPDMIQEKKEADELQDKKTLEGITDFQRDMHDQGKVFVGQIKDVVKQKEQGKPFSKQEQDKIQGLLAKALVAKTLENGVNLKGSAEEKSIMIAAAKQNMDKSVENMMKDPDFQKLAEVYMAKPDKLESATLADDLLKDMHSMQKTKKVAENNVATLAVKKELETNERNLDGNEIAV